MVGSNDGVRGWRSVGYGVVVVAVVCVRLLWDGVCGVRLGGRLVAVGEAVIALACLRGRGDGCGGGGDGGGGGWMVERGALWERCCVFVWGGGSTREAPVA